MPSNREFDGLQLVGGHAALDFVNTVEYRARQDSGDRLHSFENLGRWSVIAGLLTKTELTGIMETKAAHSLRKQRALNSAIELREALHAVIVAYARRASLPGGANRIVERHLRNARAAAIFTYADVVAPFAWHIPVRTAADITLRLADAANDFLLSLGRVNVRQCSGPRCDWLFIDRSHGHRRVWCQPSTCGNVVRVRRFRAA